MTKNKQKYNPYKPTILGRIHKALDSRLLRMFPKYRHIAGRLPAVENLYQKHIAAIGRRYGQDTPCPLCEDASSRDIELSTDTMHIMANDYPYYMFDGRQVDGHMMLVPRRHVGNLSDLDDRERDEYWRLYLQLSDEGYTTMTRPAGNERRSVPGHVHTHLIRLGDK